MIREHRDTEKQLADALREIEAWESSQKDLWFWEKLGRLPFMLLDKLTPAIIQQKIGEAVNEVGAFIQTGGRYLLSEKSVLERLKKQMPDGTERFELDGVARLPLSVMDVTADQLSASRSKLATVQGATTGFGGLLTLALDIPAILGLSLKIIQEIGICYGYDPNLREERVFAVKIMQFASSDIVGKKAILDELAVFEGSDGDRQMMSQLQGWQEVVALYRDNFGWKKLFQMIPVAGMLFGAFINRGMLNDVAEAAKMLYRKRRVLQKIEESREQHDRI
ncbi:EcsC family protein [Paenibacillus gorillae]|uniref:EcsC family protein n=1 Tax=Paenibacillus gorillae TaxID=1243662 RepID=UPI0004BB365D|nr:EcsC family protein [Paenibacillus gorillae]